MTVDVFIARQPILDRQLRLHGHELLYRASDDNTYPGGHPDATTARILERILLGFGLEPLAGGHPIYLNLSRGMLVNGHYRLLPADRVVLELLESVTPDPATIAACRELVGSGYRLALDDFRWQPGIEPLIDLATVIKVDFREGSPEERRQLCDRLRGDRATLLAEKVETGAELSEARELGFELFQGYFFARPSMLHTRDLPAGRVAYLRLLREVLRPEVDLESVERIISQDVGLATKLLRLLRSAAFGWTQEVADLHHALRLLGEAQLRRWVALVVVLGLSRDKPRELVVLALARARLFEQVAPRSRTGWPAGDAFLLGLFSLLDALTDQPLPRLLEGLALPAAVRRELLEGDTPAAALLTLARSWERGDWDGVDGALHELGIGPAEAHSAWADASLWAEDAAQP